MNTLIAIVLGLLGGIGGTILWEGFIVRRRNCKSLARIIATEIGMNMALLSAQIHLRETQPNSIEKDFQLTRSVMDSVSSEIGIFPSNILEKVLQFYLNVDHVNRVSKEMVAICQKLEYGSLKENEEKAHREIAGCCESLVRLSKETVVLGSVVINELKQLGGYTPSIMKALNIEDIELYVDEIYKRNMAAKKRGKKEKKY